VSWAAVIAGAFVAAALSLILLALGAGLGLSSVSPWSNIGASASTVHRTAIIWLAVMEVISSAMGGYIAGRLRTKWASIHTDEVYFRDTAHGFLAWCVALVVTAGLLTSAATYMAGGAAASAAGGTGRSASATAEGINPDQYFVDSLFRSESVQPDPNAGAVRGEAGIIFARALADGKLDGDDKTYLDRLVAARTGLSEADADKRVSTLFADAQDAADVARKTVAHALLWIFVCLLIGAFCASFAATIGGRQRDHVVLV
jgi:hypothetical protein